MVQTDLYFDATNQVIGIRHIDETGAVIDTLPELRLDLEDLQYATEMLAFMRRVHFTDANDATKKRCYGLFSKPEDDATDDGHSSNTEDLHLGGGGGSTRYRIKEVYGDYLVCVTWDGSDEGEDDIYIAKPASLRHSLTTEAIEGTTVNYTYAVRTNNLDGQRTATPDPDTTPSSAQIEIILPVYIVDQEILATTPEGGTGVETEDAEPITVTLEDLNVDARAWCQVA